MFLVILTVRDISTICSKLENGKQVLKGGHVDDRRDGSNVCE